MLRWLPRRAAGCSRRRTSPAVCASCGANAAAKADTNAAAAAACTKRNAPACCGDSVSWGWQRQRRLRLPLPVGRPCQQQWLLWVGRPQLKASLQEAHPPLQDRHSSLQLLASRLCLVPAAIKIDAWCKRWSADRLPLSTHLLQSGKADSLWERSSPNPTSPTWPQQQSPPQAPSADAGPQSSAASAGQPGNWRRS